MFIGVGGPKIRWDHILPKQYSVDLQGAHHTNVMRLIITLQDHPHVPHIIILNFICSMVVNTKYYHSKPSFIFKIYKGLT